MVVAVCGSIDPRQRCRGPVEAHSPLLCRLGSFLDPRQRCRGPVEAPLIERKLARYGAILGSDAEAPLKPRPARARSASMSSILGSDAEAPLKPVDRHREAGADRGDPRQRCRGPVEARRRQSPCDPLLGDPRQRCRGPVEATGAVSVASVAGTILGSDAEAPLKHGDTARAASCGQDRSSAAMPRPR